MELVNENTELALSTKFFDSVDTHSITLCGQILISAIIENQYSTDNLEHQVHIPIKDLVKHDDPNILQTMKECMVEKGYAYKDDFVLGMFANSDDYIVLYASFRTVEMAILFKLIWV